MRRLRITIGNQSYDVTVEDLTEPDSYQSPPPAVAPASTGSGQSPAPQATPKPAARPQPTEGTGSITCPMAGVIKSVLVKEGDEVTQGQSLLVLEAMKMENQITAPVAGCVKQVHVQPGESVQEGHTLLVVE